MREKIGTFLFYMGVLIRQPGAIVRYFSFWYEFGERPPKEALLISFRKPTEKEVAYGKKLAKDLDLTEWGM